MGVVPDFRESMVGMIQMPADKASRLMIRYNDYTILHAIGGDSDAPDNFKNCRCIKADTEGIVRIRYTDDYGGLHTEVLFLNSGIIHQVGNVIRLYQNYTPGTAGTAECYDANGGTLVNAIKLLR